MLKRKSQKVLARVLVLCLLLSTVFVQGALISQADATPATIFENFEGETNLSAWMVDSNASYAVDATSPISGKKSLKLHTSNAAGCYVDIPAAVGTADIAVRVKVIGTVGILRIVANGDTSNRAHNAYSETNCPGGFKELTTSQVVFTDANGTVLSNVASYDGPWGGWRFVNDFDGYMFIKNENAVDISTINVGIYHGSTNSEGQTILLDDFMTYTGTDYAAVVNAITPAAPAVLKEDFEDAVTGFDAWMVDVDCSTYAMDTTAPLNDTTSLKMTSCEGNGSYVYFPLAVGATDLGLRIKTSGCGVIRIGVNGTSGNSSAHYANYTELTTSNFVFLDKTGAVQTGVANYDNNWGGIRFVNDFDGYMILKNDNTVNITSIAMGIYHGSTNDDGCTLVVDNFFAATGTDYAAMVETFEPKAGGDAATVLETFETGATGLMSYMVNAADSTWSLDKTAALSQTTSLKLGSKNGNGSYVCFLLAAGKTDLGLRIKTTGTVGILRLGNGTTNGAAHNGTYTELTTSNFVFLDRMGNVLEGVASYDSAWGGIRFAKEFDGYMILKNDNKVDITAIAMGIYHGSTNEEGFTVSVDNFFAATGTDYAAMAATCEALDPKPIVLEDFEDEVSGFSPWVVDATSTVEMDNAAPLSQNGSLKLTSVGQGSYCYFPLNAGTSDLGLRIQVAGSGIVRIGVNGGNNGAAHNKTDTQLTTSNFVFLDRFGNELSGIASYEENWGGLRFTNAFDGYMIIKNDNAVAINDIAMGIYHGSVNADGYTLVVDNFFIPVVSDYVAAIAAIEALDPTPATLLEDFEDDVTDLSTWVAAETSTCGYETTDYLSGKCSFTLTSVGAGSYAYFPLRAGKSDLGMRIKVAGSGIVRIGVNGTDGNGSTHNNTYTKLTTENIVFLDTDGNVVENVATYDNDWDGIRFTNAFDGYMILKNDNAVTINNIVFGIFHGSVNADGYTLTLDNIFAANGTDYAAMVSGFEGPWTPAAGDYDGNGVFDASDLTALRLGLLGNGTAQDVNGDGQTDIRDLVRLKKLIAAQ